MSATAEPQRALHIVHANNALSLQEQPVWGILQRTRLAPLITKKKGLVTKFPRFCFCTSCYFGTPCIGQGKENPGCLYVIYPCSTRPRRSIVPDPTALHIHFEGAWTEAEKRLLRCAIMDVEERALAATAPAARSWLCYCKRLDGLTACMAHRAGWERVLCAYGAAELGLQILDVGGSRRTGRGA